MLGIDISQWQTRFPPGAWEFAFCRATHDGTGIDPKFREYFLDALAVPHRGAYHFWRPAASGPAQQANLFIAECLAGGFRPGVDLWALDVEETALADNSANAAWVNQWMSMVRAALGNRGFLYCGWFFATAHFNNPATFLSNYNWWLPAYGTNDGDPHPFTAPFTPVIHQFTSRGGKHSPGWGGAGLDVNQILNEAQWNLIVGAAPTPVPVPVPPTYTTTDLGDVKLKHTVIRPVRLDDKGRGFIEAPPKTALITVQAGPKPTPDVGYLPRPTPSLTADGRYIVLLGGPAHGEVIVNAYSL